MIEPVIDPSCLTKEQKEKIKTEYLLNKTWAKLSSNSTEEHWYNGCNLTLLWLFGEDFFEKEK